MITTSPIAKGTGRSLMFEDVSQTVETIPHQGALERLKGQVT